MAWYPKMLPYLKQGWKESKIVFADRKKRSFPTVNPTAVD